MIRDLSQRLIPFLLKLAYTRGTVIPIHLAFRGSNPETLKGLPEPKKIIIRLSRYVRYYQSAPDSVSLSQSGITTAVQQGTTNTRSRRTGTGIQDEDTEGASEEKVVIGQVVWQEPSSFGDNTAEHARRFDGEIHLPKEMQPSCEFRLFKLSVSPDFW